MQASASTASVSDQIRLFFSLMEGLKPEGQERSFKMAPGELLEERYLMGVSTASLGVPRLLAICSRMGMPAASLAQMQAHLPEANTVHFGYEQGAHAMVFKVYLEFWNRLNLARKGRAPGAALPQLPPLLLHLAWKWNIETPGAAIVSEYRIFPELPVAGIFERLGKLYPAEGHPPSLEAAERIVNLGARRTRTNFMYLEVTEPGNPRVSFDIRLYATELRVADVHPWLLAASRSFYIETQRFDALFKRVRMRALGHLSGGIDRAGRDFLTVYYPIE